VVGDFNEGPDGDAIHYLEDAGFRNVLPLFRPGQETWRVRSLGGQTAETLDHILFDESFLPLDARVMVEGNSDHLPVLAHFESAYH
jgi:endonuclease/exonuclease/phosphatase family metal-dependent hydrolase